MKFIFNLEDKGQDFLEIEVDISSGVIKGNSIIFSEGRLSCYLVASAHGEFFSNLKDLTEESFNKAKKYHKLYAYIKNTGEKNPPPWKSDYIKYSLVNIKLIK